MLNELFKSVLQQDKAPIVICDLEHTIVYMNPVAIERYHKDLTGLSLKKCHNEKSNELTDALLALGYKQADVKKIITKIDNNLSIEEQIKEALKLLLK